MSRSRRLGKIATTVPLAVAREIDAGDVSRRMTQREGEGRRQTYPTFIHSSGMHAGAELLGFSLVYGKGSQPTPWRLNGSPRSNLKQGTVGGEGAERGEEVRMRARD